VRNNKSTVFDYNKLNDSTCFHQNATTTVYRIFAFFLYLVAR